MIRIYSPRTILALFVFGGSLFASESHFGRSANIPIVIDARMPSQPASALPFPVGAKSSSGQILSANRRYLTLDNKPWFPVTGEFHYSRYPEAQWEEEILKMKAGGIQVISTYVFWIHHEESEGQFDWRGQRDLRHFVELCAKHGLYVWIRIGPWDHGEVRNGGLPDWVVQAGAIRQDDPVFMGHVQRFFNQIGKQLTGLFWKNGGPIIGVQLENEYHERGPGKGEDYILKLRRLARDAGLDAPFYTVTGWDNAVIPSRDVLPVFGGYADGFWWRSLVDLPPNANYFFTKIRCEENVADDLHSKRPDIDAMDAGYPFLTAEIGGGMEVAYHRRPLLSADDTAAMEVVKLGSGVVMYGYYMFHGGTNPDGEKTTLQESQDTGYPNDLPVKSYDFQAPLGEFGQMNPSYRVLKTFNLFLDDFGELLAPMTSYFPERMPASKEDVTTPRVAARLQDGHGFIFLNNYERTYPMPAQKNLRVRVKLPSETMDVPRHPVNIPAGSYAIWPVNFDIGGTLLRYATAQLLCKLDDPRTYVFFAWPGIHAEFAFAENNGTSIKTTGARITRKNGVAYIDQIEPGAGIAIRIRHHNTDDTSIIILSRQQALSAWKASLAGREQLLLSSAQLYFDQNSVHVLSADSSQGRVGFFPGLAHDPAGFVSDGRDGIFAEYTIRIPHETIEAKVHVLESAGEDPLPKMGKEVAIAPDDSAFNTAATWQIDVPNADSGSSQRFLRISYEGDVARIYSGGKLITDNFYNGTPWVIGLGRFPEGKNIRLELKILPLHRRSPIYLPQTARAAFPPSGLLLKLKDVEVITERESVMEINP